MTAGPSGSPFGPGVVIWLVVVGLLCFAGAAIFAIFGDGSAASRAGAHGYSYSANGHRGFIETLKRLDVPVVVSRGDSLRKLGYAGFLVLAEPDPALVEQDALGELLSAPAILLVLPKWFGVPDRLKPAWLDSAGLLSANQAEAVLRLVLPEGKLVRPEKQVVWGLNTLGPAPEIEGPQLVVSDALTPLVSSDEGILIGELYSDDQVIWVLSDPDLLSNHGLGQGENAGLAVAMIEALRYEEGPVIFDETIHGLERGASFWRLIFEFPYLVATLQALAALGLLVWASVARFGSPLPAERTLQAGKETLLGNMANLLQFGGHGGVILRRYREAMVLEVQRRLHAPRDLEGEALIDWLDRVGAGRGASQSFRDLDRQVDRAVVKSPRAAGASAPGLLTTARELYRWKQEMLNGS